MEAFFAKAKMPNAELINKQRFELMVHGRISYLDWAAMTHWQKQSFIIRLNEWNEKKAKEQEKQAGEMKSRTTAARSRTSVAHHRHGGK